jgi:hypothetical protein
VLGGYAVGTQYNVRLGNNALKWLQEGLPLLGEKTTLRWLGSSVVELKLTKPKEPFRAVDVLVAMEPRDIPPFWLLGHLEGRRDIVIVRAQLNRAPGFELESRAPNAWRASSAKLDAWGKWVPVRGELPGGMQAKYQGVVSDERLRALLGKVTGAPIRLTRLSIRRGLPNLELHFLLPKLDQIPARKVFESVRDTSQHVLKD